MPRKAITESAAKFDRIRRAHQSEVAEDYVEMIADLIAETGEARTCLLYTSPSPRDATLSRMPSSA